MFGDTNAAVTHPAITALPYERSIAPWVRAYFPDAEYVQRGEDVTAIRDGDLPLPSYQGVIALQGAKGLGKSKAVHAAVSSLPVDTTAVQVTFRRSLAWSSNRLMGEGAALYSTIPDTTPISARHYPRLTILVNSIARVRGCYDVVVIDELVSVVDMLSGSLLGAEARISALFTLAQLIAGARVVLVADAVLDAACLQFVCKCRRINDPAAAVPLRVLDYTYRLHSDYRYVAHENEWTWRGALDEALRAGQHVVVPCMTKGMATRLAAAYRKSYTVQCYTADVDPAHLHAHMRDIHKHWSGVQLLVYSPVITAGCSYELPHYDVIFFYGMAGLGSVRSAMQMIARVRAVATKTVHVYVARAQRYTPLTDAELHRYLGEEDADTAAAMARDVAHASPSSSAGKSSLADVQMQLLHHLDRYKRQEEALAALAFPFYFWSLVRHTGARITFPAHELLPRVPRRLLPSDDGNGGTVLATSCSVYVDAGGSARTRHVVDATKDDAPGSVGGVAHTGEDDAGDGVEDASIQFPLWASVAQESWILHDWEAAVSAARFTGPTPYPACPGGDGEDTVPISAGIADITLRPAATLLQKAHVFHPEHLMACNLVPRWDSVRWVHIHKPDAGQTAALASPPNLDHTARARLRAWTTLVALKGLARLGSTRGGGGVFVRNFSATHEVLRDECEAYCADAGVSLLPAYAAAFAANASGCHASAGSNVGAGADARAGPDAGPDASPDASPSTTTASMTSPPGAGKRVAADKPSSCAVHASYDDDDASSTPSSTASSKESSTSPPTSTIVVVVFPPAACTAQVGDTRADVGVACATARTRYLSDQSMWLDVYREDTWVLAGMEMALRDRRPVLAAGVATVANKFALPQPLSMDVSSAATAAEHENAGGAPSVVDVSDGPTSVYDPELSRANIIVDTMTDIVLRLRPRFIALSMPVGTNKASMAVADVVVMDKRGQWHVLICRSSGAVDTAGMDHDYVKAMAIGAAFHRTLLAAVTNSQHSGGDDASLDATASRSARMLLRMIEQTATPSAPLCLASVRVVYLLSGTCLEVNTEAWRPSPLFAILCTRSEEELGEHNEDDNASDGGDAGPNPHLDTCGTVMPWSSAEVIAYGVSLKSMRLDNADGDDGNDTLDPGTENDDDGDGDGDNSNTNDPHTSDATMFCACASRLAALVRSWRALPPDACIDVSRPVDDEARDGFMADIRRTIHVCNNALELNQALRVIARPHACVLHQESLSQPMHRAARLISWGYRDMRDTEIAKTARPERGQRVCRRTDGRVHDMEVVVGQRVVGDLTARIPLHTMRVQLQRAEQSEEPAAKEVLLATGRSRERAAAPGLSATMTAPLLGRTTSTSSTLTQDSAAVDTASMPFVASDKLLLQAFYALTRVRQLHRGIMRDGLCVCFWNGRPHGVGIRVVPPVSVAMGMSSLATRKAHRTQQFAEAGGQAHSGSTRAPGGHMERVKRGRVV